MKDKRLILNKWRTPDGTILISQNRHDFINHTDKKTGQRYFIDGGLEYCRYSNPDGKMENLSVYDNEPHEILRDVCLWGTYGKEGKDPLKYIKVSEMTTDHLKAVLKTNNLYPQIVGVMSKEVSERESLTSTEN